MGSEMCIRDRGTPSQIKDDNAVIEAYLGKKMDDEEMRKALAV